MKLRAAQAVQLGEQDTFGFPVQNALPDFLQPVVLLCTALHVLHHIQQVNALTARRFLESRHLAGQGMPVAFLPGGRNPNVPDKPACTSHKPLLRFALLLSSSWAGH